MTTYWRVPTRVDRFSRRAALELPPDRPLPRDSPPVSASLFGPPPDAQGRCAVPGPGAGRWGVVPGRRCARWCRLPMLRLGVGLTGSGASDPGRSTPLFCGGDVTLRGSCRRRASSRPFALMHGSRRCRCVGCVAGVCRGCLVRVGGVGVSGLARCARVLLVHLLG